MARSGEQFRPFISHKHDDHHAAARLAETLIALDEQRKCFVTGSHGLTPRPPRRRPHRPTGRTTQTRRPR